MPRCAGDRIGIAAQQLSPHGIGLELFENAAATAAGLYAIILMFERVHPEVVEAMRELDIDLADRIPQLLTRELPMAILDCTLPPADLEAQISRYQRLGASATVVEHDHRRLLITFGPTLDDQLLEQTITVERACCSFLTLDYDAPQRRLSVVADDSARAGALDVIRAAVTGERPAPPEP